MSNTMQTLTDVGLNSFAVSLVAESLLKSPLAPMTVGKPQPFFFPVARRDCLGWSGVKFTLEAVPAEALPAVAPATPAMDPPAKGTVDYAEWLADKLHNTNDYGKEAAYLLVEQAKALAQLGPKPAAKKTESTFHIAFFTDGHHPAAAGAIPAGWMSAVKVTIGMDAIPPEDGNLAERYNVALAAHPLFPMLAEYIVKNRRR